MVGVMRLIGLLGLIKALDIEFLSGSSPQEPMEAKKIQDKKPHAIELEPQKVDDPSYDKRFSKWNVSGRINSFYGTDTTKLRILVKIAKSANEPQGTSSPISETLYDITKSKEESGELLDTFEGSFFVVADDGAMLIVKTESELQKGKGDQPEKHEDKKTLVLRDGKWQEVKGGEVMGLEGTEEEAKRGVHDLKSRTLELVGGAGSGDTSVAEQPIQESPGIQQPGQETPATQQPGQESPTVEQPTTASPTSTSSSKAAEKPKQTTILERTTPLPSAQTQSPTPNPVAAISGEAEEQPGSPTLPAQEDPGMKPVPGPASPNPGAVREAEQKEDEGWLWKNKWSILGGIGICALGGLVVVFAFI